MLHSTVAFQKLFCYRQLGYDSFRKLPVEISATLPAATYCPSRNIIILHKDGFDWILLCRFMLMSLAAGQGVGNSPFTLEALPPTIIPIATIQISITSQLFV
jgi:hypothetical protein